MDSSPVTPVQRLLDDYAAYLRQERALAPPTLVYYLRFVRCFLTERFGSGRSRLSLLRATEVVLFVRRQVNRLSPKVAKLVTTALRSFLLYARYRGYITTDLAAAVPTVANWSMASIPRSIASDHVQRVLAHCNRHSAVGRRDYAILLLLARLGLRASEIAFLKLEDIDWDTGCLNVRGKGGSRVGLPLPVELGEAIATYLQTGRPASPPALARAGRQTTPLSGFSAARSLPPAGGLRGWTYYFLFGLLSVSGLRISEALNLKLSDLDLQENVLTIQNTKFGKSRLVPLHPSTLNVLNDHLQRRNCFLAGRTASHLFVSSTGNRLDLGDVHRTFYALSRQIGLRGPSASHGPRLHDFRHRFAVQTLLHWYRGGHEIETRLPILSTYLGHVRVSDTYWYLSAHPELLGQAVDRLERHWEGAS